MSLKKLASGAIIVGLMAAGAGFLSTASASIIYTVNDTVLFSGVSAIGGDITGYNTNFTSSGPTNSDPYIETAINYISGSGDFVKWEHNFVFDPVLVGDPLGAILTLDFHDDSDPQKGANQNEQVKLQYDGLTGWRAFGNVGISTDLPFNITTSLVDPSVTADGKFGVKVQCQSAKQGYYIDRSILTVDYESVPEPSVLSLLGFSLLGLGFLRRKKN